MKQVILCVLRYHDEIDIREYFFSSSSYFIPEYFSLLIYYKLT